MLQAATSTKAASIMMPQIEIIQGDITKLRIDAIVNAADEQLLGGHGVDGAIHAAAGPELLKECKKLKGCETGQAKITNGYSLPAKYVIHTVGPVWRKGAEDNHSQEGLLKQCYTNSLKLADEYSLEEIAFHAISTGAFGFPKEKAASIARNALVDYFTTNEPTESSVKRIVLVSYSDKDKAVYDKLFDDMLTHGSLLNFSEKLVSPPFFFRQS